MTDKNVLHLLDGHSLVYKAFHALGASLSSSTGEPTGAIFGFVQIFQRLMRERRPSHIVVVFDPPGPSFRAQMHAEYKAHRPPQPPELTVQFERLRELLKLMGVPTVELPTFEADDVLAAMARWATENGGEALIVSVDKDLMQCVGPGVRILREHLGKIEVMDEKAVEEKTGVRPDQVAAYLGLLGDASDNIPGVPGIGQKTAAKLLQEFGTMEAILAAAPAKAAEKKPQKMWLNLHENAAVALHSRDLATVRLDALPADLSWEACAWSGMRPSPELVELLQRLGFRSMIEELGVSTVPSAPRTTDYGTVMTEEALAKACAAIRAAGGAAIDTETTDLDPLRADLVGISLSWAANQAVYVPVDRHGGLPLAAVRAHLSPLLADASLKWAAHNWVFDWRVLDRAGFAVGDIDFDTMLASYLLAPDGPSHGLKALALAELGIRMTEIKELIGEGGGGDMFSMAEVDLQKVSDYACADADSTLQLRRKFEPRLAAQSVEKIFREMEVPLTTVLARMENEGVRLDRAHFAELSREVKARLADLTAEIHGIAGRPFNIASPKQLSTILFEELKLPHGRKTASGGYSTDVAVLEDLSDKHPLPAKLLEFRQLDKLRGTYIEALPSLVNPLTGRLHTSFNQTVAATGRLSSSDPNLQNIPVRSEDGRRIRQGFVPRAAGWKLLGADYSQIELRILAHMSKDEHLSAAFRAGEDIHALTAARVLGIPRESLTKQQRDAAKAVNFGIIYGMSAFRLAKDFSMGMREAEDFIRSYFAAYPRVREFMDATIAECAKTGFVATMMGRRRWLPEVKAEFAKAQARAEKNEAFDWSTRPLSQPERIAINTPIQGTSADMIKAAMLRIDRRIARERLASRMILQVHDELIFDCPEGEIDAMRALVDEEMKAALPLDVPIVVEIDAGSNWAEI